MNTTEKHKAAKVHTIESAPQGSKALLEQSKQTYGYVPNLHGVLAESPQAFEAYLNLHDLFTKSGFNADEITVVWQTINVENECHYCVPAHTAIAHAMKVDAAITKALRNETALDDARLETLRRTTLSLIRNHGKLSKDELIKFYDAGFTQKNIFDILLGIAQKTISNYSNHIFETPVDENFTKFAWEKNA